MNRPKLFAVCAAVSGVLVLGTPLLLNGHGGHNHPATVRHEEKPWPLTVKGEVVDLGCFLSQGAHGADHAKCALQCAQMGMPIGLLTEKGKLYLLAPGRFDEKPFEALKAKAGERVSVTGIEMNRDGILALEVNKIET